MADWTQRGSVLTASDTASLDNFGIGVAISGDGNVLAAGAYGRDSGGFSSNGAVYIFDRSGSSWAQRGSAITASDAATNDFFGYSLALDSAGTRLVVGAQSWEGSRTNTGGVYTFSWNPGTSSWDQVGSVLQVTNTSTNMQFGNGVALSADGQKLVVGARGSDVGSTDRGQVFTFAWNSGTSSWDQVGSAFQASDAAGSDRFGSSVAISSDGTILAVGADQWEGASGTDRGGVYIYDWNSGTSAWDQRGSVLEAGDAANSDLFGFVVALNDSGARLFVGARQWEGATGTNRGGVYQFDYSGGAWSQTGSVIEAGDASDSALFGSALACDGVGNVLIVGAEAWSGTGGAYTYDYTPPPSGTGSVTIRPTVVGAGDFNNSTGATGTGAVTIYPAAAGAGTFPTVIGSGTITIRPAVAGAARIDVSWTAGVSSAPSTGQAAMHAYEISWSAAVSSAQSEMSAEAWAGTLEMPSIGIGYAIQGAERTAVASITITCEIGGIAYPAQYLTIRKRLAAGDGTARYGTETADVAIPYTRAVFSALLAASRAGESIILSARYVLDSGEAYVRPLGDFALTAVKRSANGATVIASGERFPVYAVSDDPVLLAGSCYETARSVRCAVDHQVYPGQAVQGMAAAFTCDAVTITLDAPQASAIMEVFARN